ncbi:MAG TPA: ABC transporter ATP-binding protein [Gemmataceae bacterium]|jgi:lipopolysaccharide transport system ATP-binding protein
MGAAAVRVEGLGKRYRIGGPACGYRTLREGLRSAGAASLRAVKSLVGRGSSNTERESFWALRDVSFEVGRGEVVGIIGRNGAGKSTLLKVLSRITDPTEGLADIHGRVGSLLEVGTGFHPELTGRENVYLNGAILGMRREEVRRKFDDIVAFAEVEKFIDTPVKRYSSGMYLRLAFAVAAHLEPEILIVDEVLAVGDAAFQKKCMGKMESVAGEGRTVLFVSHDMTNIAVLCDSVLLLEGGRVRMAGPPAAVIEEYVRQGAANTPAVEWDIETAPGDDLARIVGVRASGRLADGGDSFALQESVSLTVEFVVGGSDLRLNPVFLVKNALGTTVFSTANYAEAEWGTKRYQAGRYRAECRIPAHLLNEGRYSADVLLVHEMRTVRASATSAIGFGIYDDGTTRGDYVGEWVGIVRPHCDWMTACLGRSR